MLRRASLTKLATCLLALAVVLTFPVVPAFAEDPVTDPATDPGTDPVPVPFLTTGVVVVYDLPGVISTLPDGGTDGATTGEVATTPTGPYITVANQTGEITYPVADTVVIEAPKAETGEYVINVGDLAQVSGNDGVADRITVTPAVAPGGKSQYAAVPGSVQAIGATGIVVLAADGLTYSFIITATTAVFAGPLTVTLADILVGDWVVVKGDGAGNAKWIRFTGQSSKAVRNQYGGGRQNGGGAAAAAAGQNGKDRGNGNGGGNGHGNGSGKGNGRGPTE